MKNYIVAIDNEIKDYYDTLVKNFNLEDSIDKFSDSVVSILDYYAEPIFTNGKNSIRKKLGLSNIAKGEFNEDEQQYLSNYKLNELDNFSSSLKLSISSCFNEYEDKNQFYLDIIEIIIGYCIKLFKISQLFEYRNNNVDKVYIVSDENLSCPLCSIKSKFEHDIDDLINDIDNYHPYCKMVLEPLISNNHIDFTVEYSNIKFFNTPTYIKERINSLVTNLKIYIPDLITDKRFIFVDEISEQNKFIETLENKFDSDKIKNLLNAVNGNIESFKMDDVVMLSNKKMINIEYNITKSLIEDKLATNDLEWWRDVYYKRLKSVNVGDKIVIYKEPFISYIGQQNYQSYFLESAIHYVISPKLLKAIDGENYERLKSHVFNGVEFMRG